MMEREAELAMRTRKTNRRGKTNTDLLIVGGMLLGWFALQGFILPSLGVPT
jgi:hypothetical protein